MPILILFILTFLSISAADARQRLAGKARYIDADTFIIGERIIRLHGIDAPESGQRCKRANGKSYLCGKEALAFLIALTGDKTITCEPQEKDIYGREIALCWVGNISINAAMVEAGQALAYRKFSDDFSAVETRARAQNRGLWSGTFEPPWRFRTRRWQQAGQEVPNPECPIKGNISRKGERIYHTPWSQWYKRTKINTARGERWFCNENEAVAAGWRAPYR